MTEWKSQKAENQKHIAYLESITLSALEALGDEALELHKPCWSISTITNTLGIDRDYVAAILVQLRKNGSVEFISKSQTIDGVIYKPGYRLIGRSTQ